MRQLNSEITAKRNVNFMAFALIKAENVDFQNSMENQFKWLENQGFDVVEHKRVTQDNMKETVEYFGRENKNI